jgi:hypothetical protein
MFSMNRINVDNNAKLSTKTTHSYQMYLRVVPVVTYDRITSDSLRAHHKTNNDANIVHQLVVV